MCPEKNYFPPEISNTVPHLVLPPVEVVPKLVACAVGDQAGLRPISVIKTECGPSIKFASHG
jgi:hypothetical protein